MKDVAHARLFDRALQLRDAGELEEAITTFREVAAAYNLTDSRLYARALLQLGNLLGKLGRHAEAVATLRAATDAAPRMELASLSLFHALANAGERVDALCEAFRFVALRESLGYRELFAGDTFRGEGPEEHELADQVRVMLDAHRDAQRRRALPMPSDTVRVSATAQARLRPGSLATLRGRKGRTAHLLFSDGEVVEADITLVDHHDI
ncbi:MAG TPA: tetratricopeptide repeat protein [Kofleriaceae bacterium]